MDYCCTRHAPGRAAGTDGCTLAVLTLTTWPGKPPATALGSNRNAVYKAPFEARRILRARLAAHGGDLAYLPGALLTGLPWLDDLLAADPGIRGAI